MSASPSASAPSSFPLPPSSPKPLQSELSPSNPASTSNIPDAVEAEKANPEYNPPVGFKCLWEACPMNYEAQDDLVKHVHGDHIGTNRESYTCEWAGCRRKGQAQGTRHALVTHMRGHTGEKPYTCPQPDCGSSFTRSDAMNKHLRSLHGVIAEPTPKSSRSKAKTNTAAGTGGIETPTQATSRPGSPGETPQLDTGGGTPTAAPTKKAAPRKRPSGSRKKVPASAAQSTTEDLADIKPNPDLTAASASAAAQEDYPISRTRTNPRSEAVMGEDGITYIRYGSDADLISDPDLYDVLPRIRERPILSVSPVEAKALSFVRSKYPHSSLDQKSPDSQSEENDPFDEHITSTYPDESGVVLGMIGDETGEVKVFGRSRWGAKYIMAKAKLMLVEEESRMRGAELSALEQEERELRQLVESARKGKR